MPVDSAAELQVHSSKKAGILWLLWSETSLKAACDGTARLTWIRKSWGGAPGCSWQLWLGPACWSWCQLLTGVTGIISPAHWPAVLSPGDRNMTVMTSNFGDMIPSSNAWLQHCSANPCHSQMRNAWKTLWERGSYSAESVLSINYPQFFIQKD